VNACSVRLAVNWNNCRASATAHFPFGRPNVPLTSRGRLGLAGISRRSPERRRHTGLEADVFPRPPHSIRWVHLDRDPAPRARPILRGLSNQAAPGASCRIVSAPPIASGMTTPPLPLNRRDQITAYVDVENLRGLCK
jgi:hypothetical protein